MVRGIIKELYIGTRLPLFHAKPGRTRLVPHSLSDHKRTRVALRKLTPLVLHLMRHWLNVRRRTGVLTVAGFDMITEPLLANAEILVTADDALLKPEVTLDDPLFEAAIPISTKHSKALSEPGLRVVLGRVDAGRLSNLGSVAGFIWKIEDTASSYSSLEAGLTCESIDRLEAQMGVEKCSRA